MGWGSDSWNAQYSSSPQIRRVTKWDDLTDQQASQFKTMVDECILENSEIPEMREGLAYIDDLAQDQKISIYDLLLNLYTIVEAVDVIDEWEKDK